MCRKVNEIRSGVQLLITWFHFGVALHQVDLLLLIFNTFKQLFEVAEQILHQVNRPHHGGERIPQFMTQRRIDKLKILMLQVNMINHNFITHINYLNNDFLWTIDRRFLRFDFIDFKLNVLILVCSLRLNLIKV